MIVAVTVPVSEVVAAFWPPVKLAVLAFVEARFGPDKVMVQPTPAQNIVSESTQLVARVVEMVNAFEAAPGLIA